MGFCRSVGACRSVLSLRGWLAALLLLVLLPGLCGVCSAEPAPAEESEGVREQWGEFFLVLKEPVVSQTVLENTRKRERAESRAAYLEGMVDDMGEDDEEGTEEDEGEEAGQEESGSAGNGTSPAAPTMPSAADCGLELFSVSGSPAPKLRWVDQNRLSIVFAPGSSPETEYRLVFKPGVTYLSGAPLANAAFSFRCKPAELTAEWLPSHAGGMALLSAARSTTREAQQLTEKHEGLRVCFRRLREVPLLGWVYTSATIPARLQPATLAEGPGHHSGALRLLLEQMKPEDIHPDTPLPQCLLAVPEEPLVPGARYDLELTAAEGSGIKEGIFELGSLPDALHAMLSRELVQKEADEAAPYVTRLTLSFSYPVFEEQLHALWERLGVSINGVPATRGEDGAYRAELGGKPATLHLRKLMPCTPLMREWHRNRHYTYAPAGCAEGLEMELQYDGPAEVAVTLPPDVSTPHGLALGRSQTLCSSSTPATPAMTGNGCNLVALSGEHRLSLPLINVEAATATAYRWDAKTAARLLPLIEHGMRDDTHFAELYRRLFWMRRRAQEDLPAEGWFDEDARTSVGRALHLLKKEHEKTEPLREQALAAATAYAPQVLPLELAPGGNALVTRGEAIVNLDELTGGKLRPGLYLISVTTVPTPAAREALVSYGMNEEESSMPCTVDYLVQVTDIAPRRGMNRLMVNNLATGQPLEGVRLSFYTLPAPAAEPEKEEAALAAAREEARPAEGMPALTMAQGEATLPADAKEKLLLLQRGEDYVLHSLVDAYGLHEPSAEERVPMAELFCDRPLYRPGDVVHLRGVLRRPTLSGVALPHARHATLTFYKPSGEEMGQQHVSLDAYGAFSYDFTLPKGEEDVTGEYACRVDVEECGKKVHKRIGFNCQVFRRDAFTAELKAELEPVAPKQYRVKLQATDYNGTPLAGGKMQLKLHSDVRPLTEAGTEPAGLRREHRRGLRPEYEWEHALVLDAEGKAELGGRFEPYERVSNFSLSASIANDREEYVQIPRQWHPLHPVDFSVTLSGNHLMVGEVPRDGVEPPPLDREQKLQVSIRGTERRKHHLPSGFSYEVEEECELDKLSLTVPAHCTEGIDLNPYVERFRKEQPYRSFKLLISGLDAAGRRLRSEHRLFASGYSANYCSAKAEGRMLRLEFGKPLEQTGRLHAYISSQGRMRHCLVDTKAGEKSVFIPLDKGEYGEVCATLLRCKKDIFGLCTDWERLHATTSLPRPDKELKLEFSLPQGAEPGQQVQLCGRVTDAEGKPVKAAVTLFAVDAGMMNVAWYGLPELATDFYAGEGKTFSLDDQHGKAELCRPKLAPLPDVWTLAWPDGTMDPTLPRDRSVWPKALQTNALHDGPGALYRMRLREVLRAAQPNFRWSDFFGTTLETSEEPAVFSSYVPAAPCVAVDEEAEADGAATYGFMAGGLRSGSGALAPNVIVSAKAANCSMDSFRAHALAEADALWDEPLPDAARRGSREPRLRSNFEPVALWLASLETAEDGSFSADCLLPDTLTTYEVYAVALGAAGDSFGQAEGSFLVNQELMLTAGTPFFMSTGDKLLLPLTITNNGEKAGSWEVTLEGAGDVAPQQIELAARATGTLFFEVKAAAEGECRLRWTARSADAVDAVEGSFPVRYPAPLLKEAHRLVLAEGAEAVKTASLLAPEVAGATRGTVEIRYSTSPLIHLAGSVDFLLSYPYGCTEQRSSALLPWLFYEQLAPFCPQMAQTPAEEVKALISRTVEQILARQQADGGLSYWAPACGEEAPSCPWASAYAALVLTLAQEQGAEVSADALTKLRHYLEKQEWQKDDHLTLYAAARACGRESEVNRILVRALRRELKAAEELGFRKNTVDLEFMAALRSNPSARHEALLSWLRSKGHDYRHRSSWSGGWTFIALAEYLRLEPAAGAAASLRINGETVSVAARAGRRVFALAAGQTVAQAAPELAAESGTSYVTVSVKAQPEQTEYPGVTEKGLQVTRLYEVRDAEGNWREASEFKVGDVVRVTLTCAKMADELEYFVLEDYLPACMEAINPHVPSQAAGLEDGGLLHWSRFFDHREYLADRVRGFCTRWWGRDVVNMRYYARVKRAGECTAPPAEAQLMYEPQTYGLSPNGRVRSE